LQAFLTDHRLNVGLVSPEVPLISNLPVWSNIALIRQYHENLPGEKSRALVIDLLERFGMTSIAEKRNPFLTEEERFCVMFIRAATIRDAIVCLDRPFRLLPARPGGRFFTEALQKIDDLIAEVHIFDYSREKEPYETNDGAEN
jgi:ABC-type lipoprotein export system ATPase subunit